MSTTQLIIIEPLVEYHDRQSFYCGIEPLDNYLKKQAKQDVKRRISRVFIATLESNPTKILGYYTLSTLSLELTELPTELARKLPKHPVPAALIGRLACSNDVQSQGVGKMLLMNAIKRTINVSDQIGIYTIVVDAINHQASGFYMQYGFSKLSKESKRLFLAIKSFSEL